MARKRALIDTGTDKRYVRRNERGTEDQAQGSEENSSPERRRSEVR